MLRPAVLTSLALLLLSVPTTALSLEVIEISPANKIAMGIEIEVLGTLDSADALRATGLVIAPSGATQAVTAPMGGVLVDTYIVPGMMIKKGQKVALLYSDDYALTRTALKKAELAAEHDDHLAERAIELRALGLRSEAEMDEAQHEARTSRLSLQALKARLAQSNQASGAGHYYATAKQTGLLTHLMAQTGETLAPHQPIAKLLVGEAYWASIQVPDSKIDQVSLGMPVYFDRNNSIGEVIAIDPEVDTNTRAVNVMVALPKDRKWRLGQIVSAAFRTDVTSKRVTPIPTQAIVRMNGESFVFVETAAGFTAKLIKIETYAGQIMLVSGDLSAGDKVAVSGTAALKNLLEAG